MSSRQNTLEDPVNTVSYAKDTVFDGLCAGLLAVLLESQDNVPMRFTDVDGVATETELHDFRSRSRATRGRHSCALAVFQLWCRDVG